jgi:DNA-binding MarR family transcriptional regulator
VDQSVIEILSRRISAKDKVKKHINETLAFAISRQAIQKLSIGELPLGYALSRNGTAEARLIRGLDTRLMYLIGMPGQGKTNLLRMLAHASMLSGDKVIIISRKGWEFSPLLRHHEFFYDMNAEQIRLNPFYAPLKTIPRKVWNQKIAGAISSEGWLIYGSATNFEKVLDAYTEKFPNTLVTPSKLVSFVSQRKIYKLIQVDEKVKNRLEALTSGEARQIFDTNELIDFDFYAQNNLNFNLSSLSPNQISYFIAIFLEFLTTWKMFSGSNQRHVIILDDFADLASDQSDNLPRMNEIVKTITVYGRKLNIDLWIVAQSAFNTSRFVLDNATTIIRFKTGGISDKVLEPVLRLSDREEEILSKCPAGFCAVLRKMVHNKAFLAMIPYVALQELSIEERDTLMEVRMKEMREKYLTVVEEKGEEVKEESELDTDEIHILKDYAIAPYESVTEKANKLGYSTANCVRHIKGLKENGYLQEVSVSVGKSIGVIKLYKLTAKGIEKVGKQNLVGRGSLVHGYWMYVIKRFYELDPGNVVELEKYFEDVSGLIDVAVFGRSKEKLCAIEIALSNKFSHEVENIEKCLKAGFQKAISATVSETILKGIKKEALNRIEDLSRVEFRLLKEFYYGAKQRKG